jgi:type IV pilus assembly protein PilO
MAAKESVFTKITAAGKVGIGLMLTAATGAIYYFLFYSDVASSIQAAQRQEQQLRNDLAEARRAEFAYQKDLTELNEREQRQRDLVKILPSTTEYPAFLSAIQGVATSTGVNLTAWTPQEEVVDQFYSRVPMKLEFRGKYHQIAKFFFNTGQLDRIINMENISMTEPGVFGDDVLVKVEALATAFRAVESREAAQPAGGAAGSAAAQTGATR